MRCKWCVVMIWLLRLFSHLFSCMLLSFACCRSNVLWKVLLMLILIAGNDDDDDICAWACIMRNISNSYDFIFYLISYTYITIWILFFSFFACLWCMWIVPCTMSVTQCCVAAADNHNNNNNRFYFISLLLLLHCILVDNFICMFTTFFCSGFIWLAIFDFTSFLCSNMVWLECAHHHHTNTQTNKQTNQPHNHTIQFHMRVLVQSF